jgi:hypothetical protein
VPSAERFGDPTHLAFSFFPALQPGRQHRQPLPEAARCHTGLMHTGVVAADGGGQMPLEIARPARQ